MGRNAVMRKALGTRSDTEYRKGARILAEHLEGDVALFFTNDEAEVVKNWFQCLCRLDYARPSTVAPATVLVPKGPVHIDGEPAPHAVDPQLRRLGMKTTIINGCSHLTEPHTVCSMGDKLTSTDCTLLKVLGYPLAKFQMLPQAGLDLQGGRLLET